MLILLIAAILRVLSRPSSVPPPAVSQAGTVRVLSFVPSRESWRDVAMHVIARTHNVRALRIFLMVECEHVSDASDHVDARLQGVVDVEFVPPCSAGRRGRKLLRHGVRGDETCVVLLDRRTSLVHGWDTLLLDMMPEDGVVTCPVSAEDGRARYPTIGFDGTKAVRAASQPFAVPTPCCTPSVCVCLEFVASRPETLKRVPWSCSAVGLRVALESNGDVVYVPTVPLLSKERSSRPDDEPVVYRASAAECVGLTSKASDEERILKFGSCAKAKLAIRLFKHGSASV